MNNSIFGIQSPKVVYNSNTIQLEHSVIINDKPINDLILHPSIINRHREWVVRGRHWLFEINLLLWKYKVNAQAKYDEVKAMEGDYVNQLFRRKDGTQIKDSIGNNVRFLVEEISETYIDRWDYPDVLRIRFLSEKYVAKELIVAP